MGKIMEFEAKSREFAGWNRKSARVLQGACKEAAGLLQWLFVRQAFTDCLFLSLRRLRDIAWRIL